MIEIKTAVYNHYEKIFQSSCDLNLNDITLYHLKGNLDFRNNFLNGFFIFYMSKGNAEVFIDDEIVSLKSKNLLLVSPYRYIKSVPKSATNDEIILYTIEFDCNSFNFFDIKQYLKIDNAESVEQYLTELYNNKRIPDDSSYFRDAWLLLILHSIKKLSFGNTEHQQLAKQIQAYIVHNIMQPISVAEISNELKYNKDYLSRVFKKEFSMTIKDFINKEKTILAKRLLQTSDLSISAISQLLGWEDVNLFLKYFKYHEKISPSHFRQNTVR